MIQRISLNYHSNTCLKIGWELSSHLVLKADASAVLLWCWKSWRFLESLCLNSMLESWKCWFWYQQRNHYHHYDHHCHHHHGHHDYCHHHQQQQQQEEEKSTQQQKENTASREQRTREQEAVPLLLCLFGSELLSEGSVRAWGRSSHIN